MAFLLKEIIKDKPYHYGVVFKSVEGKHKIVHQTFLWSAEFIIKKLTTAPELLEVHHLAFGEKADKGHWHREPSSYSSLNGTQASSLFDQDGAEEALKNSEWVITKIKSESCVNMLFPRRRESRKHYNTGFLLSQE